MTQYVYILLLIYIHKPKRKENINHHLLHQGFKTIDLNNVEEVVNNTPSWYNREERQG